MVLANLVRKLMFCHRDIYNMILNPPSDSGDYFLPPDEGCKWDCCQNVIETCNSEMNYDYSGILDYDNIDDCVEKKSYRQLSVVKFRQIRQKKPQCYTMFV